LITRELEHELSASEGKSQETGDTSSTETFDDLDVLSGVEEVLRVQLEGEPENGKGEVSASDEGEMVSFVDLVRSIEEELSYVSQAPPPVPPRAEEEPGAGEVQPREPESRGTADSKEDQRLAERKRHLARGLRFYRRKDYQKAIEEFVKVVEEFPEYKEAWNILGNAYYRAGLHDEALRAYQKVKELDPLDTDAYENIGVIYANRGEYGQAIEEWQKILKIDPARRDILYHIQKAKRLMSRRGASP